MKSKVFFLLIALMILLFGNGCKKWRNNREPLTSENHTLAEASFNQIFSYLIIAASPQGALLIDSCFSFPPIGDTFPKTFTIDFGSHSCPGLFEYETTGKLNVTLSDSLRAEDAALTATPENLYIKGYKVEGTITIVNKGLSTSGHQLYNMGVVNGLITSTEDKTGEDFTVSWKCDYQIEVTDENNEAIATDDLHQITGTVSGVNQEDRSFSAEIIEPLQKYVNCRWPGSGKTKIAPDGLDERDLNYGDCTSSNCCDGVASEEVKWPDKAVHMD